MNTQKRDKTYEYVSRNDDGGKKEIGYGGLLFGAIISGIFLLVFLVDILNNSL